METKPATYTTEFWLTIALQIVFSLNTMQAWTYMPQKWSGMAQAIIAGAYLVARGIAKNGVAPDPNLAANYKMLPRVSDGLKR